jgi:mannose-6-phosphate isomerase-like protein (cupin superfamily)
VNSESPPFGARLASFVRKNIEGRVKMTSTKTLEAFSDRNEDKGEWLQVTPGERFRIRIPSVQTMGAYTVLEVVADPHNGVPLHIHNREEEHFIVLDGTLDIAIGDRRWDAPAGTSATVRRGVPHAWCNPSNMPLHMLVIFSPGQIDGMFRAAAGVGDVDRIAAIAGGYGTQLIGPPLQGTVHSIYSPPK